MFIIKLDAIGSTNSFLKEYIKEHHPDNFTTVVAELQTQGRGQMGTNWESQKGKNLTFSVFIKKYIINPQNIFDLNCVITTSILYVLKKHKIPDLSIKWPNDILSANKKIVGILIENSIKANAQIESIIGIGINVNQKNFDQIPNASSIYNILGHEIDKDELLTEILEVLKTNFDNYAINGANYYWSLFHDNLYKKNIPSIFFNHNTQTEFVGTIKKVTSNGLLEIELADKSINHFGIKEISIIR
jgi:BirA family transcriptional regulator, biotin operon repressor / biotin---[acetyl-CoA-carboxylase] ligase